MPILLKTEADIAKMRASGRVVADVHARLRELIQPGVTTAELDQAAVEIIATAGGAASFLGYYGYPASICASINDVVVHGIPGPTVLRDGDIISVDVGVVLNGFHADAAFTQAVGEIDAESQRLIEVTEAAFWRGVEALTPGGRLGDMAAVIQRFVEGEGFGVVRDFAGHGVGRSMHEDPSVPNWGKPGTGSVVRNGMTLAIEPMVTTGSPEVRQLDDGWTVVTQDGGRAAHYEHTVAVSDGKRLILTALDEVVI